MYSNSTYLWVMDKKIIFSLLFLVHFVVAHSQSKPSDVTISVLTCAPGKEIYSIYGHNAIRIQDRAAQSDMVYNYGTFDFDTPGFTVKFMRGKLPYLLAMGDFVRFMREYQYFERAVTEQVLDLDSIQKQKIIDALTVNMLPENRAYKYDFFMDNCATRLRDILHNNVAGITWDQSSASNKTFRQIIKEYQKPMPWTNFGIDLIIGAKADRKTTLMEETFIPDYLAMALDKVTINNGTNKKIVLERKTLITFPESVGPNKFVAFLLSPIFFFIILLIVEVNILMRSLKNQQNKWIIRYDLLWFWVVTICSLLMVFMWVGTDHIPTKDNWNLLWASPLIPVWWWMQKEGSPNVKYFSYFLLLGIVVSIVNAIPRFQFLPQYFHPAVILLGLIMIMKGWRLQHSKMNLTTA